MDGPDLLEDLRQKSEQNKKISEKLQALKLNPNFSQDVTVSLSSQTFSSGECVPSTSNVAKRIKLETIQRQNSIESVPTSSESLKRPHSKDGEKLRTKLRLSTPPIFDKRPGTSNSGKEFEQLMCGLYALKLIARNDVEDFQITSNNVHHNDFDDVGLEILFKNGTTKRFLFQLKHKENQKPLTINDFQQVAKKHGPFSAGKYFKSIFDTKGSFIYILYTNAFVDIRNNTMLYDGITIYTCARIEYEDLLTNVDQKQSNFVFKFTRQYQEFYLFSQQNDVYKVVEAIKRNLQDLVKCDIYDSFVQYMSWWWSRNYILTRDDFVSKVAELVLSSHALDLTANKCNERTNCLKEAIMEFQITIVAQDEDIVSNIWNVESASKQVVNEISNRLKIDPQNQAKILWFLGRLPFVVKITELNKNTIKSVLYLLKTCTEKRNIVLLGNFPKEELEEFVVFENLHDLCGNYGARHIYANIVKTFCISLQGRKKITLEQLLAIDADIAKIVTTKELFEMSQVEQLTVGKPAEKLPELHIPRTVTVNVVKTEKILEYSKQTKDVMIINCKNSFKGKHCGSSLSSVLELSEFQKSGSQNTFEHTILLSTDSQCTHDQFNEVCEKCKESNVFLFEEFDEDTCLLLSYRGKSLPLESIEFPIEERNIFNYLKSWLNIVCAPPGMGKSRLMTVLSRACPSDCWVAHVNLIDQNMFFTTKPSYQNIEARLLELEDPNNLFCKRLQAILFKNKKVKFILDGLDEVYSKYISDVIKFVKNLLSKDINVWIASRENLREMIFRSFNPISIHINELNQEQQGNYIYKKLEKQYQPEKINKIINAVSNSVDLNNSQILLGIPLQLHILTEMFLNDPQAYDHLHKRNIFVLTQMYKSFFQGKIKSANKKVVSDGKFHQLGDQDILLEQYQIPALMVCLDEAHLNLLNLQKSKVKKSKKIIDSIKIDGDKLGVIKAVKENDVVIFDHQTYAEYFACVWLDDNREKAVLLRDVIFSERYENMRLMLNVMIAEENSLHLAVIYQNDRMINQHINDVNQEDEGGRTVLHLACTYGKKYHKQSMEREPEWYISLMEKIVDDSVNIDKKDQLFTFTCKDYSLKARCFYPFEKFIEQNLVTLEEAQVLICQFGDFKEMAFVAAKFGYSHLLSSVIDNILSKCTVKETGDLLITTIRGCQGDRDLKTRQGNITTVQLLLNKGVGVNQIGTEDKNYNPLDVTCAEGYYDMIEILRERGGICTEGNTILHRFAESDFTKQQLDKYIESKEDVNAENNRGQTPLHLACMYGNNDFFKKLLEKEANPYCIDNDGTNSLMYALKSYKIDQEIINYLINLNHDINARNKFGRTSLHLACQNTNIEIVKKLLAKDADANIVDNNGDNCLLYSLKALQIDVKIINYLIGLNIDINARNESGLTALHLATKNIEMEIIQKLLEKGADANITDNEGNNCLIYTAQFDLLNTKIIDLLTDSNLDLNARNECGLTLLHLACKHGNIEIVETLLKKGAEANIVDNQGNNCLVYALQESREIDAEIIHYLTDSGLDLDARNDSGMTALHLACKHECAEIVQNLVERGANVNVVNNQGDNCLMYGLQSCEIDLEIISHLIGSNLNINARNKSGTTVLHLACQRCDLDCIEHLINNGAEIVCLDNDGNNLLHYAAQSSHWSCVGVIGFLKSLDFEIESTNNLKQTPLLLACKNGSYQNVINLLYTGANPNVLDINGESPISVVQQRNDSYHNYMYEADELVDILVDRINKT